MCLMLTLDTVVLLACLFILATAEDAHCSADVQVTQRTEMKVMRAMRVLGELHAQATPLTHHRLKTMQMIIPTMVTKGTRVMKEMKGMKEHFRQ